MSVTQDRLSRPEPMGVEHECRYDFSHRQVSTDNSIRSRKQPRPEHGPTLRVVRWPFGKRIRA